MMVPLLFSLPLLARAASSTTSVACAKQGVGFKGAQTTPTPSGAWVHDAAVCQTTCLHMVFCNYFVWYPDSTACWLVGNKADLVPHENAIAGPKSCSAQDGSSPLVAETDAPPNQEESSSAEKLEKLSAFIRTKTFDTEAADAADKIAGLVRNGSKPALNDTVAVVGATMGLLTPEEAAEQGLLVTREELDLIEENVSEANDLFGAHGNPEEVPGLFEGDMVADDSQKGWLVSHGAGYPWPDGKVSYCYSSNVPKSVQGHWEASCREVHNAVPGITFKNVGSSGHRCSKEPAILVTSSFRGQCTSYVGMTGGSQELNLDAGGACVGGTTTHELLHALGMEHEQSRPDRDQYVTIIGSNINPKFKSQYEVHKYGDVARPYDIMSLMHYSHAEFSVTPPCRSCNRKPTMSVKPEGYKLYTQDASQFYKYKIGQRTGMSKYDVAQLSDLYGCSEDRKTCKPKGSPVWTIAGIVAAVIAGLGCLGVIAFFACKGSSNNGKYQQVQDAQMMNMEAGLGKGKGKGTLLQNSPVKNSKGKGKGKF